MLVERGEARRLRFRGERGAGDDRARPRLLARRRNTRCVLRGAHGPDQRRPDLQPLQRGLADPHLAGPLPPAKFVFERTGRVGHALDSIVCAGVIVSGGTVRRSIVSPHGASIRTRGRRSVLMHDVDVGRGAVVRRRDRRQERADRARRAGRGRCRGRPQALRRLGRRHHRDRQGRHRHRLTLDVALLTREYPPEVYGGAGVHVEYLARELATLVDVTVHCWGAERTATGGGTAVVPTAVGGARGLIAARRGPAGGLRRSHHGCRSRWRRPRSQPHLVREPRRPPRPS